MFSILRVVKFQNRSTLESIREHGASDRAKVAWLFDSQPLRPNRPGLFSQYFLISTCDCEQLKSLISKTGIKQFFPGSLCETDRAGQVD